MVHAQVSFIELQSGRRQRSTLAFARHSSFGSSTSAVFLFDGGCAVAVLFILVCGVALLQSKRMKASGHWTQHGASAIQLNNSRNMSRTCTSAAELFYLRHTRSCAATACGNKGSGTNHFASVSVMVTLVSLEMLAFTDTEIASSVGLGRMHRCQAA